MKTCPNCRARIPDGATFCELCFRAIAHAKPGKPSVQPVLGETLAQGSPRVTALDVVIWALGLLWIADGTAMAVPDVLAELKSQVLGETASPVFSVLGAVFALTGVGLLFGQGWGYALARTICLLRIAVGALMLPVCMAVATSFVAYPFAAIAFSVIQLWVLSRAA
jgi:hypothetical protein